MDLQLLSHAKTLFEAGFSVIPADRASKRPAVQWKAYQTRIPTLDEWTRWALLLADGIGVVTGVVSGNLVMLDFDQRGKVFKEWFLKIPVALRGKLVMETSQSGGVHVIFQTETAPKGNRKFASDENGVLIETRGEGGYFVCAPTAGYEFVQGSFETVQRLTQEEEAILYDAARTFHISPETQAAPQLTTRHQSLATGSEAADEWLLTPGDDFNRRCDIRQFLTDHGWTFLFSSRGKDHYRRPGKDTGGESGNWSAEHKKFYCFSQNAAPLEGGNSYSPFALYVAYDHGGNWQKAVASLINQGYGQRVETDAETMQFILNGSVPHEKPPEEKPLDKEFSEPETETEEIVSPGDFPKELMDVPGLVNELQDYINSVSYMRQPVLALAAALAAQAALCGRNVRDDTGTAPNLYIFSLAPSGCGKSAARDAIKEMFRTAEQRVDSKAAITSIIAEKADSYQGLEDWMEGTGGTGFLLWDEIGEYLQVIGKSKSDHRASITNALTEFFTASSGDYRSGVTRKRKIPLVIMQPSLTFLGTSVPGSVWKCFTRESLTNGFLARFLIFTGEENPKEIPNVKKKPVPEHLVEYARDWLQRTAERSALCTEAKGSITAAFSEICDKELEPIRKRLKQVQKHGTETVIAVWRRGVEFAKKLAIIYTYSQNPRVEEISLAGIRWGVKMVMYLLEHKTFLTDRYVVDSDMERNRLKATEWLRKRKDKSSPRTVMYKYIFGGDIKACDLTIDSLAITGEIKKIPKNGGWIITLIK